MRLLTLVAVAAIALSGCGAVPTEQHFTVPEDAPATTDTHTGDGYDLRVYVVDENGTPLSGAAIVLFTMGGLFGGVDAEASAGSDGARAVAFWQADFQQYDMVAGLRTNSQGWAEADLQPNRQIHAAAGDVEGMTTEVTTNVAVAGGGQKGSITIKLYPDTITYTLPVTFGNHGGTAGIRPGAQESYRIDFSDDGEASEAYRNRVYALEATATWTNDLQGGADLHVGIGDKDELLFADEDKQQYVNDGEHTEDVEVTSAQLDGLRPGLVDGGYFAYLITDWASLSFDGIDVEITVEAQLKGSNIAIN